MMKLLFVVLLLAVSVSAIGIAVDEKLTLVNERIGSTVDGRLGATIPKNYTLFKQCDPNWGSQKLGTSTDTICSAGCAMSSVAMILNTQKIMIGSSATNPSTLNQWLISHGGYADGDELVWGSVNALGSVKMKTYYHGAGSLSSASLRTCVDQQQPVVVNVRSSQHWVLVVGYDGDTFYVNDPGYAVNSYAYSGMSNFVVYTV